MCVKECVTVCVCEKNLCVKASVYKSVRMQKRFCVRGLCAKVFALHLHILHLLHHSLIAAPVIFIKPSQSLSLAMFIFLLSFCISRKSFNDFQCVSSTSILHLDILPFDHLQHVQSLSFLFLLLITLTTYVLHIYIYQVALIPATE